MKPFPFILLCGLLLAGCVGMDLSQVQPEEVFYYSPLFTSKDQIRAAMAQKLNAWLGSSKDDRIRAFGPPQRCTALSIQGEVCEWQYGGVTGGGSYSGGYGSSSVGSWERRIIFSYNKAGIAQSWNVTGTLGQFSSAGYR